MAGRLKCKRRTPFAYRRGVTLLHRCPAALKLIAAFAVSIAAFVSAPGLAAAWLIIITASLSARIRPWELLRGSHSIAFFALLILVFKTLQTGGQEPSAAALFLALPELKLPPFINPAGFIFGALTGLRMLASFAAGALLFSVTTMRELRRSLEKAAGRRVSLGLSLMLMFIPRFFEIWEDVNLACEARAGKRGIRRLLSAVPQAAERMMYLAAETAEALQARGG
jgi:biotin transport system permease protein